jgi:hypothetical protein
MTGRLLRPGLVPSATLVPTATLVPFGPLYGGGPVTPHQIAMGVGAGGSLVDVSSYVEFGEGVQYTWGRTDQFDDTNPGTFTFTLNNADGRFTPGNPASPLATTVVEGMAVSWLLGARLVAGAILAIEFGTDEESWDLLKVTCDDMLGSAGRHQLTTLADGLLADAPAQLLWKLDDEGPTGAETATSTASSLGAFQVTRTGSNTARRRGHLRRAADRRAARHRGDGDGAARRDGLLRHLPRRFRDPGPRARLPDRHACRGCGRGVFPRLVELLDLPRLDDQPRGHVPVLDGRRPVADRAAGVAVGTVDRGGHLPGDGRALLDLRRAAGPQWVSMRVRRSYIGTQWWVAVSAWVNDVQVGPEVDYNDPQANDSRVWDVTVDPFPVQVELQVDNTSGTVPLSGTVQRVSHTVGRHREREERAPQHGGRTPRGPRLHLRGDRLPDVPGHDPVGRADRLPDVAGRSVLDVYNDIQRTEQGHLFTTTSGTLTAPVQVIQIRARDRPTTVKAAFHVTDELDGLPVFLRDISNVAATIDVAGPTDTVTVTDPTVKAVTSRYLTLGLSESDPEHGPRGPRDVGAGPPQPGEERRDPHPDVHRRRRHHPDSTGPRMSSPWCPGTGSS